MKRKEFKLRVRMLATPEDFQENEKILDEIEEWNYLCFINCLIYGANIPTAKVVTFDIFQITKETRIDQSEVFETLPKFSHILKLFEIGRMVD